MSLTPYGETGDHYIVLGALEIEILLESRYVANSSAQPSEIGLRGHLRIG